MYIERERERERERAGERNIEKECAGKGRSTTPVLKKIIKECILHICNLEREYDKVEREIGSERGRRTTTIHFGE